MNLASKIQTLLASPKYHPMRRAELARALKISTEERNVFRKTLDQMLAKGDIVCVRKNRFVLPQEADLVVGRIDVAERGFAFVIPEVEPGQPKPTSDIYVAEQDTGVAMHGDKVVVRLERGRRRHGQTDKPTGRVIRILERTNPTIVGTLQKTHLFHYVIPDDPRIIHDIYTKPNHGAQVGDKVVVKLAEWKSRHVNPEGEIVERLGKSDAPGVDILAIIRKHQLPTKFDERTQREADRLPETVPASSIQGRLDLRRQFIVTIDPDDARDFDDAVNVEELPGGGWKLGVHIADVSHYVTPDSALDREAYARGNSVYLVDRVIPMLPEKLANNLCSLRPREDRLTVSCFIEFAPDLAIRKTSFARTVIHSQHRLTYKQAFALLTNTQLPRVQSADPTTPTNFPPHLGVELKKMWALASKLRAKRFAQGALALEFPEVKVRLDDQGKPTHIEKVENDISHQLIEEFMLAANEAVARHTCNRRIPAAYRIHEDPDVQKLQDFREYAQSFGFKVGDVTHRHELQKLLEHVKGKPEEYAVNLALLRSLKKARYSPDPVGHYGLAKKFYTHFTSPIRRYADLVVHRTLIDSLTNHHATKAQRHMGAQALKHSASPSPIAALHRVCEHISRTERTASEAEQESVALKKIEYFQNQVATGKRETFNAVVSTVRNFGIFVELTESLMTGLIHISNIDDDFYLYDEDRERIVGKRTNRIIAIGDKLQVQVERVDIFKRQIDFRIVSQARMEPRSHAKPDAAPKAPRIPHKPVTERHARQTPKNWKGKGPGNRNGKPRNPRR
jgi:ribonuclease R